MSVIVLYTPPHLKAHSFLSLIRDFASNSPSNAFHDLHLCTYKERCKIHALAEPGSDMTPHTIDAIIGRDYRTIESVLEQPETHLFAGIEAKIGQLSLAINYKR
jgi:hypothetical protein